MQLSRSCRWCAREGRKLRMDAVASLQAPPASQSAVAEIHVIPNLSRHRENLGGTALEAEECQWRLFSIQERAAIDPQDCLMCRLCAFGETNTITASMGRDQFHRQRNKADPWKPSQPQPPHVVRHSCFTDARSL